MDENAKSLLVNTPKKIHLKKEYYNSEKTNQNYANFLPNNKKVQNEIETISNEFRNTFREALNKHSFTNEVFVPRTLIISKKEYLKKDYLLNRLVKNAKLNKEKRRIVEPLSKETTSFSKHYKLVEKDGAQRKEYLTNLEKFYETKGYRMRDIEYKKDENIFTPSVLLDNSFGENTHKDVLKYGSNNFQKNYMKDKKILNVIYRNIHQNRYKKKRNKTNDEILNSKNIKNYEYEADYKREETKKQIEQIKEKLIEEDRIRNMSPEEYFNYAQKIKKDINKIKESLKDLNLINENKSKIKYNSPLHIGRSYTKTYALSPNKKLIPKNNIFDKNEKFLRLSYHCPTKNNTNEDIIYRKFPELILSNRNDLETAENFIKNESNIFVSSKGMNLYSTKTKTDDIYDDILLSPIEENKKKQKQKNFSQIKELNKVYKIVLASKKYKIKYPLKYVENYFKNYTKKKLPALNSKNGSNVHGLVDDFQDSVKNKNFHKIAKSNNDLKRDFFLEKGLTYQDFCNKVKTFDIEKIENIDNQIPVLHYNLAEKLLTNLKDVIINDNK